MKSMRSAILLATSLALTACQSKPQQRAESPHVSAYADSQSCASCHAEIAATYAHTGMARSFYKPNAGRTVEDYTRNNRYFHKPSNTWFQMLRRGDTFYQRRWQVASNGHETNAEELQIDYIMGSGNNVRTYLHRTVRNTLIELPLAWYPERGGTWAMNPGYEGPHLETRRKVAYECMFCHNAYPEIPKGAEAPVYAAQLPEGIDCQRCHGPGSDHVIAARAGSTNLADTILNPSHLTTDRQMDICMQCHLQSTAAALPSEIRHFGRAPFSYNPAEPLTAFKVFFERHRYPGTPPTQDIEIVSSAYRLRQSQCFLKSAGRLVCETCHNPHDIPRAQAAVEHYDGVCHSCHTNAHRDAPKHDCAGCHMPKRSTTDVVHAVITDHLIQRRPLAPGPLTTPYRGEVIPYYPAHVDNLIADAAQVINNANLAAGIPLLQGDLAKSPNPEAYIILGDAERHSGNPAQAALSYQKASELNPASARAFRSWAVALKESGNPAQAAELLKRAVQQVPNDPENWYELGLLDSEQARSTEALTELRKAIDLDPDLAAAYNNLGVNLSITGQLDQAQAAFHQALQIDPYDASTHSNLARALAAKGAFAEALPEFATAAQMDPANARNHYLYGMVLANLGQTAAATRELKLAASGNDPSAARDAIKALR
jgi:Tfp pilus assembly protein PilF